MSDADFLCLQEIDHYEDHYKRLLEELGYQSVYVQRQLGWDGSVLAYKAPWQLRLSRTIDFDDIPEVEVEAEQYARQNVGMIGVFTGKQKTVCVGVAHLFWDPQFAHVKLAQAKWYRRRANQLARKTAADALILTGDFNSLPDSDVVVEMQSHEHSYLTLNSAYKEYENGTYPPHTNFTFKFVGTLDHIFYSENLQLAELLRIPEEAECRSETALPNSRHGSDHLPIGAVFVFSS